ncbi:MAG: VWA domain-containing protein [Gammaproteobacteria bacterium]|nr:VWA domain-containing protein [Gammaproteobacteria bacterium]
MRIFQFLTIIINGLIVISNPAFANGETPMDAVVIMDSSGSMKKTDPRELRKPAAKLFITLLESEDSLSVVSFSDNAYPVTFLTQLNTEINTNKALKATERISSRGVYTNIYAAIKKGLELLRDSHNNQHDPILILMSDGKMDVGNNDKSAELQQKIFTELLPEIKKHHIKIYSIAFTTDSDQTLLQEIADATDGRYALAASDDALHKVFAKLFEQSKEPNMLPLTENQFVADKSIREITIIANKKDDKSQIFLETPAGERINSTTQNKNIKWFISQSFDMITLIKPEEGTWKILFSDNDNKAYIVADIKLRSQFKYNPEQNGDAMIETWLIKDDKTINNDELLRTLELKLEIENPEGKVEEITLSEQADTGIFTAHFTPTKSGIYAATVMAKSKTFQRQQFFSFRAKVIETSPVKPEPEALPQPEQKPVPEPEIITTPVDEPEDSFVNDLMLFIIINIAIIFIGVNIYFAMQLMKNKKPKPEEAPKE